MGSKESVYGDSGCLGPPVSRWGPDVGLTVEVRGMAWNAGFSRHSGPQGRGRFVATLGALAQPRHPGE